MRCEQFLVAVGEIRDSEAHGNLATVDGEREDAVFLRDLVECYSEVGAA